MSNSILYLIIKLKRIIFSDSINFIFYFLYKYKINIYIKIYILGPLKMFKTLEEPF